MSTVILYLATIISTLLQQVLIFENFQVIVHDNKTQLASLMSLARKRVFKVWESALSVSAHETTPTVYMHKGIMQSMFNLYLANKNIILQVIIGIIGDYSLTPS